jgi:Predicted periplasmic or secreted lipoprotein
MLHAPAKSAGRIEEEILKQLRRDARVDEIDIQVAVEGDAAILTGSVASVAARRAAEADASIVPGIRAVDNRLIVRREGKRGPDDDEIAERIRDSFRWNSTLDNSKIKVTLSGGIVTLEGTVPSLWQKFKAQEIAENTAGVLDVDNVLSVVPAENYADDLITEEVTAAIIRNLRLSPDSFQVLVEDGVVTLLGNVPDLSAYRAAENIAYYVEGVIAVKNDLVSSPRPRLNKIIGVSLHGSRVRTYRLSRGRARGQLRLRPAQALEKPCRAFCRGLPFRMVARPLDGTLRAALGRYLLAPVPFRGHNRDARGHGDGAAAASRERGGTEP